MSTKVRPELSKKNKYWINKHRYYELKHFVLQYPIWKEYVDNFDGLHTSSKIVVSRDRHEEARPVEEDSLRRIFYSERVAMLTRASQMTDSVIGSYILRGILDGLSYDKLRARYKVPCSRDKYYELYRKFFWLLSDIRK